MDNQNRPRMIDKLKEALKVLPYLLPAIALSLSLASSLLVAGATKPGHYSPMDAPTGITPTPTPSASEDPESGIEASFSTTDGQVMSAATGKLAFSMGRSSALPPTMSPASVSTTAGVANAILLTTSDPQSALYGATLPNAGTTFHGSAVWITGDSTVGLMFHYQPQASFHGTEDITVVLTDSLGAMAAYQVHATSL